MTATTYVDGRWRDRPERRIVPDPADNREVVAEVSLSSAADVDAAYAAADRSARAWANTQGLPMQPRATVTPSTPV